MGQTKRQRKKYTTPSHPWQKERIDQEKELKRDYGLKNKEEIWKSTAKLRKVTTQVKKIIAAKDSPQALKEKEDLLTHLMKFKLIAKGTDLDDILELTTKDFLERRLQTIVFKRKVSRTIDQARQMIVHGHVLVDNKKITIPSYLVNADEEGKVVVNPNSRFAKEDMEDKKEVPGEYKGEKKEVVKTEEKPESPKEVKEIPKPKVEEPVKKEAPKTEEKPKVEETPKTEEVKETPKEEVKEDKK
ncbi:30S ribosomal protein S4 [archaeon]|jgi:small subunit ribosomal protein S4|nr:30S ribosomal protein S4 [archaeon]MBT6824479.1 30S ribosomal protein S4 [archaeon]MBT7106864.1 30S ribosomal protein S4 [archaeon]MBT7297786.1 30S ribosomal protein S4 [archaeon]